MMSLKAACPQQVVDDVPVESAALDTMLPGARASTVIPSAVANSLFRWSLNTQGAFRSFLLSVVTMPKDRSCCPTSSPGGEVHVPIWPMPVPYPEVFTKKVDSGKEWWKCLICMQILALSWLVLGEPHAAPMELRLGTALTPQQWSVVSMLRRLSFDSNTPEFVDSKMMSRAATKFESMEDTIGSLHRSLLACDDGGYFGPRFDKAEEFDDAWMRSGSLIGRLPGGNSVGAKPVVASRLEFPGPPTFDPVPFFDAETAELFLHPLDHATKPEDYIGPVPAVSIHGSHKEKLDLLKKLADCKRLEVVAPGDTRDPFVSGLFAVGKNILLDRLILDARPPNLLEAGKSLWCGSMASCSGLGDLTLEQDEVLCCSGLDLKDFFYQFVVSPQRIARNTLAGALSPSDAAYVFGREFDEGEGDVRVALATLAMGDLLACEFSQSAHLSLCLRHHVMQCSELMTIRTPVPRSKVVAGVIIDDLVVMEKLIRKVAEERVTSFEGACDRIKSAVKGYSESTLEANIKKSFFNETSCRFWGGEVDGKAGLVRASSLRGWPLAVITMKVAMLGYSSVKLLETLAGAWISVLSMRRRMFCILDIIFEPLGIADGNQIVALSPALQDEMCILSSTFLLAVADLRADFLPMVSATDASGEYLAAVRAPLPEACAVEFSRYALKKGTWSRLLPPGRAALRAKGLLDPDDELPGVGLTSHPLWSYLARGLEYEEVWVSEVFGQPHINLLELKAFLKEERRLCSVHRQKRCLSGLDSQVCLGALVKGRSSSPSINRALRCSLAYPLGASFHNYFMYFLSEENRADGPSRHRLPDPPDLELPDWFQEVSAGEVGSFDSWIRSLGPDFSLSPFDFGELDNSGNTDIRPRSHLSRKEKRKESQRAFASSASVEAAPKAAPEALPSLASAADFVSPDSAGAAGDTNTTQSVGVREPFMKFLVEDQVQGLGFDEALDPVSPPPRKAPSASSTTTKAKTLSTTTIEALPSLAPVAGFVSPEEAVLLGSTKSTYSVGVREPFKDQGSDDGLEMGGGDGLEVLMSFPLSQFVHAGERPNFSRPGAIDLFSGCRGVARAMVAAGAPWVLTFDIEHSVGEDLLDEKVREKIRMLLKSGLVKSLGMAPICASFSKAITPPVRSSRYPRGKPGLSKAMRRKVSQGNSHAAFCIDLVLLCRQFGVAFFLENPDGSWMWKQRGFKDFDDPGSLYKSSGCVSADLEPRGERQPR